MTRAERRCIALCLCILTMHTVAKPITLLLVFFDISKPTLRPKWCQHNKRYKSHDQPWHGLDCLAVLS